MQKYLIVRNDKNEELCKEKKGDHLVYWWGTSGDGYQYKEYELAIAKIDASITKKWQVIKKTINLNLIEEETVASPKDKNTLKIKEDKKLTVTEIYEYTNHCYKCGIIVSSNSNERCENCRWYICICGSCKCNKEN